MLKKVYAALGLVTRDEMMAMMTVDLATAEAIAKATGNPVSVKGALAFATIKGTPVTVFEQGQVEYDGKMAERKEALESVPVIEKNTAEAVAALEKEIVSAKARGKRRVAEANSMANAAGTRASEVANLLNAIRS